jgi:hypothetical protein
MAGRRTLDSKPTSKLKGNEMKTTATKKVQMVKPVCNDLSEQTGKATPRPWAAHSGNIYARKPALLKGLAEREVLIARRDDKTIHDDKNISIEEMHANAALIVKAVNSYDALVAALDKINAIVKEGVIHRNETGKPQWNAFDEIRNIVAAVRSGKAGS